MQIEWAVVQLLTAWILLEKRTWMYGFIVFCSFRKFQDLSRFTGCLNFFLFVRLRSFAWQISTNALYNSEKFEREMFQ